VPYAIYYSPNGFDARAEIVDNVIQQMIRESEKLKDLSPLWKTLYEKFRATRKTRNAIVRGMPGNFAIRGKITPASHHRLGMSSEWDATFRMAKYPASPDRTSKQQLYKVCWLRERVDNVNRLLATLHEDGNPTLPEKFAALRAGLLTTDSH
jgi:hypothetical protein